MKKIILSLFVLIGLSSTAHANDLWSYEQSKTNGTNNYTVYAFDENFDNSVTFSCDDSYKDVIVALLPNVSLTHKKNSVISFVFDNEPKLKFNAQYNGSSAYLSKFTLESIKQPTKKDVKYLVDKFRTSNKVKVGLVKKNGRSHYFDLSLKGSSRNINQLLKKCSVK